MILKKSFYERETVTVANELVGKTIVRKVHGQEFQKTAPIHTG